ncbi:hypothetical protein [Actinokineospora sp. NPDC004072]
MKFAHVVAGAVVGVLVTGCGPAVTGQPVPSGSGSATPTTTPTAPATTPTTSRASIPSISINIKPPTTTAAADGMPPLTVDESLPAQYCDATFKGALGKPMHAVVVETPGGVLGCEEAGAILFDYYAQRPEPEFGLDPVHIGPLACNQAREGQLAQVICADADNLIYAMWPQT